MNKRNLLSALLVFLTPIVIFGQSISGTISGANLLFQVTMGSSTSATVTVIVDKITV